MKDKLLITGASGFVGTPVLNKLLTLNKYDIHIITHKNLPENTSNIKQHSINLLNELEVTKLLEKEKFTHLIHMAWYLGRKCQNSEQNIHWLKASLNLVEQFFNNGGKKLLVTGSVSEYDFNSGICKEDSTPLNPLSLYGQTKVSLCQVINKFAQIRDIDFKWVRLFNLYGKNEKTSRIIPYAITQMLKDEAVNVSDCTQVLNFLNIEDASEGIVKIFESEKNGIFNICADEPIELKKIIELIKSLIGYSKNINYGAIPASFDSQFVSGDNTKLKELGWKQKIQLQEGLSEVINWWKEQEIIDG